MRAISSAVVPAISPTHWECDGVAVTGLAGESLAASLIAIGRFDLRDGPHGEPRGMFCGMGVCGECMVTVDDKPNVRACMTKLASGMRVVTRAQLQLPPQIAARPSVTMTPDVLVVGGGPAGMSAALAAHGAGVDVVLLDERETLGGQYFKPLAPSHASRTGRDPDRQFRAGRVLRDAVAAAGITCLTNTVVWGADGPGVIAAMTGDQPVDIRPRKVILATGAFERAVPLRGWTLPNVMTTGAAQTMIRANRVIPGTRIVIAGNGPLNWQLAAELVKAGANVVRIAEASRANAPRRAAHLARMVMADHRLALGGLRMMTRLWSRISFGTCVIAIDGVDHVTGVMLASIDAAGRPIPGTERRIEADMVALGYGFYAANELARALGCRHHADPRSGGLVADRDAQGQTSVAGIYLVGDGAGLGGAPAAQTEGEIAGLAAAASLGFAPDPKRLRRLHRELGRHRKFQAALWSLFAAPLLTLQLADAETIVCRCEGLRHCDIATRLAPGQGIGGLKRQTRAGMGRCQGRYCGPLLAELAAAGPPAAARSVTDEAAFFAPRPPFRPMPLGLIARRAG